MYRESVDTVVIGAGVVGLAVARSLSLNGNKVIVLESEKAIGTGISSRNSEVIHAGIYYPKNTLKAKLCVKGKDMLYRYIEERQIPYQKCGKIIVATNKEQQAQLEEIKLKAENNRVYDLRLMAPADARSMEPELRCSSALFSPSTGIIDTHSLMLSLQGDLENHGGECVFLSSVLGAKIQEAGIELKVKSHDDIAILMAKKVINAAGLFAVPFANNIENFPSNLIPPLYYAKGNYFSLSGKNPFKHLIYPIPEKNGLGVHLTIDMSGRARFGPDVEWVDNLDYEVCTSRSSNFYPSIREYWPNLPEGSLVPDYAGIRPKIKSPEQADIETDFLIQGPNEHGVPGLVNLFGIESPGLTASLAIAEHVKNIL